MAPYSWQYGLVLFGMKGRILGFLVPYLWLYGAVFLGLWRSILPLWPCILEFTARYFWVYGTVIVGIWLRILGYMEQYSCVYGVVFLRLRNRVL